MFVSVNRRNNEVRAQEPVSLKLENSPQRIRGYMDIFYSVEIKKTLLDVALITLRISEMCRVLDKNVFRTDPLLHDEQEGLAVASIARDVVV